MKILLMNSARTWGGTEKWSRMAAESLAADHDVFLAYRKEIVGERFCVIKYRLPCLSHIDLYTLFRLVRIIRNERIDVIIPTKRKDYLLAGLAARICGISNILRLGIERRLRIPVMHRLIYHTLADGIIVNAEKIKRSLLVSPFMKTDNIRVIYNGVDTATIDRLNRLAVKKNASFLVATAGVLTNRKGHDFLIRGFARFRELFPGADAGLLIMGEGPKEEELRALAASLRVDDRTVFAGFVDNPYPYMASSDVFAMTSTNEGISNALLESMYLGNVPVSTEAGGTSELVKNGENGFLVEYGNEQQLAEILGRLYSNSELRHDLAAAAKKRVTDNFTLAGMQRSITGFCREKSRRR